MSTFKKTIIKIGSYIILVFGVLFFLVLIIAGCILFISFPDASFQKKMIVVAALFGAAIILLLLVISVFESMAEINHLEETVEMLEEETNEDRKDAKATDKL